MDCLRPIRPTLCDSKTTTKLPTMTCRIHGLLVVLLSSALRNCHGRTLTRQVPAAFLHPLRISIHGVDVLPVRFYGLSLGRTSSSCCGVLHASNVNRVEDEQPSQPAKRGRGRPRIARDSPGVEQRVEGCSPDHKPPRQSPRPAKGRGRGRVNNTDSRSGSDAGGTTATPQQPGSGVFNGKLHEHEQIFANTENTGNMPVVSSELQELEKYADALAKAGEVEDSIAIKRQLEQLCVSSREAGDVVTDEHLNDLIRKQLDEENKDDEEAVTVERRRRRQHVETKAIENEMHERHTRRQRKQRDQILASQQRQRQERDGEEQSVEAMENGPNNNNGWEFVGSEGGGDTIVIGAESRGEKGECKDEEGALPSALDVLETVEALLGEDDNGGVGDERSPYPEDMDGAPDDEEITLLREVREGFSGLEHTAMLRAVQAVSTGNMTVVCGHQGLGFCYEKSCHDRCYPWSMSECSNYRCRPSLVCSEHFAPTSMPTPRCG